MSALPQCSDVDLLGYGKRIVNLNSEIADCTLDSSVAQQELKRVVLENNLLSLFVILEQHRSYTQFRSLVPMDRSAGQI